MTHVSMISLYDYKEKSCLVPSAQESVLSHSADKVLYKWVRAKQLYLQGNT